MFYLNLIYYYDSVRFQTISYYDRKASELSRYSKVGKERLKEICYSCAVLWSSLRFAKVCNHIILRDTWGRRAVTHVW